MATVPLVQYEDAAHDVKEIFDDIKRTRNVEDVNNFWKALAVDPATLKRTWESLSQVMAPGALDARTKEMLYLAVSMAAGSSGLSSGRACSTRSGTRPRSLSSTSNPSLMA